MRCSCAQNCAAVRDRTRPCPRFVDFRSKRTFVHFAPRLVQLKAEIDDLRRECELLKEANTKLVSSAFNADREREFREKERALQLKIAQLEAATKADLTERGTLLDRITMERSKKCFHKEIVLLHFVFASLDNKRDSEEEHRQMHLKYLEMREKYDDLAEKMRFFERVRCFFCE